MKYEEITMKGDEKNVRFLLEKPGNRQLIVFGVNPSTATDLKADATMTKVMGFAERNGFDGFVMLNLYPQRSTSPGGLHKELDEKLHRENLEVISGVFEGRECPVVLLAFGNAIGIRPYLNVCLRDIVGIVSPRHPQWKQIGQPTASGNPRHPSRAAYGELVEFDMNRYIGE